MGILYDFMSKNQFYEKNMWLSKNAGWNIPTGQRNADIFCGLSHETRELNEWIM